MNKRLLQLVWVGILFCASLNRSAWAEPHPDIENFFNKTRNFSEGLLQLRGDASHNFARRMLKINGAPEEIIEARTAEFLSALRALPCFDINKMQVYVISVKLAEIDQFAFQFQKNPAYFTFHTLPVYDGVYYDFMNGKTGFIEEYLTPDSVQPWAPCTTPWLTIFDYEQFMTYQRWLAFAEGERGAPTWTSETLRLRDFTPALNSIRVVEETREKAPPSFRPLVLPEVSNEDAISEMSDDSDANEYDFIDMDELAKLPLFKQR